MLGDKAVMVSKFGELNVIRERRPMHHLGEETCMGQEFCVLIGKSAVIRMFPRGLECRQARSAMPEKRAGCWDKRPGYDPG